MPINLQCPQCGNMFGVPDNMAGHRVACQCGQAINVFAAAAHQGGFQQPDAYGRSRGGTSRPVPNPYASPSAGSGARWIRSGSHALRTVANGLGLVLIGMALWLLAIMAGSGVGFLGFGGVYLAMALAVGSRACGMIGALMCLVVPQETGAKPLILVSVALNLLAILVDLAGFAGLISDEVRLLGGLASLASFVCFVLFMRTLSSYIGRADVAENASVVLWLGAIMIGLTVLTFVLAIVGLLGGDGMAWVALLMGLGVFVLGIIFLVKYIGVLGALRNALLGELSAG